MPSSKTVKLVVSVLVLLVLMAAPVILLLRWDDEFAYLAATIGAASGWIAGILLSPYNSERQQFTEYARVAAGFITGFLVSKVDRSFEALTDERRGAPLFQQVLARRVLIGICAFLLAMVFVFIGRRYYYQQDGN